MGDPSGSHSERWNLDVSEHPSGRAVIRHCNQGFGTPGSAEYALVKGKAYTFRLRWGATDPWYTSTPRPDYDWQCLVNDSTAEGVRSGLYGTGAFTVEDPGGLLTGETHGNETDITLGREGRIIVPKMEFFESAWTDHSFSPSLGEAGSLGVRVLPPPPEVAAFRFMEVTGKRNRVMLSHFKRLWMNVGEENESKDTVVSQ